jgi:carboxylesterase
MAGYLHPNAAPFRLPGDREDAVLLLHGWTGSPAHLLPLGRRLNEAGYTAVGPLLAGHGTVIEDMVGKTWRDWIESALAPALELIDEGKRLHLVGLSMGGVIALLLAPVVEAASVVTINAPQRVWDRRARFGEAFRGSDRIRPSDPAVPAPTEMLEYQQQYQGTPIGTIAELKDLIRAANRNLHRVRCPALIIQSHADETVKPVSGEIIFDRISSAEKGLVWLENARHVALLDDERHTITTEVIDHLGRHSAAGSST